MGTLSPGVAICVLSGAAVLGVIGTLVTGSEPGFLLGLLIVVGCVVAALGIRRRAIYLLIPLPAFTFFLSAVLTGAVHDRSIDTTKTELGASFLQWIANVFFGMCAATILILVIGGARWLLARQFVSGQFAMSAGRGPAPGQRADREPRPPRARGPWGPDGLRDSRAGTGGRRPDRDLAGTRDQRDGDRHHSGPIAPGGPRDRRSGPGPRGERDPREGRDPRGTGAPRANPERDPWGGAP